MLRTVLLAASQSEWLRSRATRYGFVRRAVSRFMPGETLDDMLRAAAGLREHRIGTVFTRLGENVIDAAEADAVTRHYLDAIDRVRREGIGAEPSVKSTQLGLDLDTARCAANLRALAVRAHEAGTHLWIDMEQSAYVDRTLELARRLREEFAGIGVCLQAYLHRTREDLERLQDIGAGVRLVKGAYMEPSSIAFQQKRRVDENFFFLATRMLDPSARARGGRAVFGTHDRRLIDSIRQHARQIRVPPDAFEFHLLYGIRTGEQRRLAADGAVVRVLIAYGTYWFPWYMRRLAERPANLWFLLKNAVRA